MTTPGHAHPAHPHAHAGAPGSAVQRPPLSAEQAAHLGAIIESAMDAFITVDESQKIVMFNRAAEKIFGVPASEAIGSPLERFIPERFRVSHAGHVKAFGQTHSTQRSMGHLGTLFGLRSDGKEFPVEASISHARSGGQSYFTVILRDVSEKMRLEAQLLQAQKMESIGRFAGGIAHDFNNLLMVMFNYLALATRRLEPEHPARPHLAHTQEVAERAAGLTRQLLAFARKQNLGPRTLNPRDVVSGIEPILRRMIGEDLQLKAVLSPDTGSVKADGSQLEQVLMNLAVNARDAMPKGGVLTIETGNVVLDEAYCRSRVGAVPGEHVMIAVTDSGSGMTPEVMARLFEPFFTTKPQGKGTGLGLATCHGIVSQHGGHISVYSELGRGTSFKIFLPRVDHGAATPAGAAPAHTPPRGGTETILLAEDSQLICDLAANALRESGYKVLAALDGQKALQLAKAHDGPIHLLVSDVVMPELSGADLAAAIIKDRPNVKVIYMSGYTEETISQHGVRGDGTNFIAKPFMISVLQNKVREVLDAAKPA